VRSAGNIDRQEWAREYQDWDVITLAGRTICLVHDLGDLNLDPIAAGFDMVI
jgi:hypothetical protein